ncbi:MAG: secondary thiamine-phosphate synthase enzyme YjbQ [Muribaculaceae bacterium]|nr:secondary thiamine-phosphate synthase enzyme YjbQ [Muribaculaceae bacterium]
MIRQIEIQLKPMRRGCHLVTGEIMRNLPSPLPEAGLLNVFVKHTSCGLTINENADPDVRHDLDSILDHIVPEKQSYYYHTMEGPDDMPAHAKATLTDISLTIPITNGRLCLGTWQGIYLCEFRDYGGPRTIVLTVYS